MAWHTIYTQGPAAFLVTTKKGWHVVGQKRGVRRIRMIQYVLESYPLQLPKIEVMKEDEDDLGSPIGKFDAIRLRLITPLSMTAWVSCLIQR